MLLIYIKSVNFNHGHALFASFPSRNPYPEISGCGLQGDTQYLQKCSRIPHSEISGCGMENLQIINYYFKLLAKFLFNVHIF